MLKQPASGVLTSFKSSTYPRGYASGSSLAAALLDGLFEHPAGCTLCIPDMQTSEITASLQIFSAACEASWLIEGGNREKRQAAVLATVEKAKAVGRRIVDRHAVHSWHTLLSHRDREAIDLLNVVVRLGVRLQYDIEA